MVGDSVRYPRSSRLCGTSLYGLVLSLGFAGFGLSGTPAALAQPTANPLNPVSAGHFRVANPAQLEPRETEEIYGRLIGVMEAAYRLSSLAAAAAYREWPRYNSSPYPSAQHGSRFVNNYANHAGGAYGKFEQAGRLPIGSILAKDSFSVDAAGNVRPGPLFLMEKMPAGFRSDSGDWRYSMVLPDGSLFGVTKGENAENVEFCIGCHAQARDHDHLYFLPERYRVRR